MRCPACFGTGRVPVTGEWIGNRLTTRMGPPCPDCGGSGAAHCCDGLMAQPCPEPSAHPTDPELGRPRPTTKEFPT